jgi:hypothetical protein
MEGAVDVFEEMLKEATDLEANPEEIESEAEHEKVPKEGRSRNFRSTEEAIWVPASIRRVPLTAEKTNPGK